MHTIGRVAQQNNFYYEIRNSVRNPYFLKTYSSSQHENVKKIQHKNIILQQIKACIALLLNE